MWIEVATVRGTAVVGGESISKEEDCILTAQKGWAQAFGMGNTSCSGGGLKPPLATPLVTSAMLPIR